MRNDEKLLLRQFTIHSFLIRHDAEFHIHIRELRERLAMAAQSALAQR